MLYLRDVTLREGLQTECFHWSMDNAVQFIDSQQKLGIKNFEIGLSNATHPPREYIQALTDILNQDSEIALRINLTEKNKAFISQCPLRLGASFTIQSPSHGEIGTELESLLNEMIAAVTQTLTSSRKVRIGIEHAFLLPPNSLQFILARLSRLPVTICLSDSSGQLLPQQLSYRLVSLQEDLKQVDSIAFHFHNDIGLAAALFNTVYDHRECLPETLIIDCSVAGVGERNGIVSLGEIFSIMLLRDPSWVQQHFDLKYFAQSHHILSKLGIASTWSKDPLSRNALLHNADSHRNALTRGDRRYAKLDPSILGYCGDSTID